MRKVICHPCHRVPFSAFGWTHRAVVCAKNVGLGRGGKPVCAVRSFLFNRTVHSAYSEQLCVQFLFCTCTNLFCTGKNLCRNVKILYQIILYSVQYNFVYRTKDVCVPNFTVQHKMRFVLYMCSEHYCVQVILCTGQKN